MNDEEIINLILTNGEYHKSYNDNWVIKDIIHKVLILAREDERQKIQKKALNDLYEILNNLNDDLKLDLESGENGYISYLKSYQAVKKYTLKVIKNKIKKIENE